MSLTLQDLRYYSKSWKLLIKSSAREIRLSCKKETAGSQDPVDLVEKRFQVQHVLDLNHFEVA